MNKVLHHGSSPDILVRFWGKIFRFLKKISVFTLVRNILKKMNIEASYNFVDYWVIGNLVLSVIASMAAYHLPSNFKMIIIVVSIYGAVRIFEILIYQINVVLFDPFENGKVNKNYKVKSIQRMVLALIHNYIEIMFWYAGIMIMLVRFNGTELEASWGEYVISNIMCVATLDINMPVQFQEGASSALYRVAFAEVISGIIMTIISLARFIGLLPAVSTIADDEE